MKKTITIIATVLGFIAFFPSALTIFGPEQAFGVMHASSLVYLVYLMPITWVIGLICYRSGIKNNKMWLLYLALILWTVPFIITGVIEGGSF